MNTEKTDREESFEEWFKEVFPNAYRNNPYEARAKAAWSHQAKKISQLQDKLELSQKRNIILDNENRQLIEYNGELKEKVALLSQHKTHYTADELEGLEQASEEHQEMIFKIEALEKENENYRRRLKDGLLEKMWVGCQTENKNLIAALKKAEGAMFGACDKSLTVPEDIKEYRDSLEYQKISHLMED